MKGNNGTKIRTIKKEFILADKVGRGVKGAGGYVGSFLSGAIIALKSKNGTDSASQETEEED